MVGRRARDDAPRYETLLRLAAGGMATVYVGTVRGALGFRQLVAIKKPHAHLLQRSDFRQEFLTEARLASLLHHAHVVDVRDVEATHDEVSLIMDYVEGASLGELLQVASMGGPAVSAGVAVRIVLDACTGLQAAHELCDERGRALHLVHRDISPQNLLVGLDGVTRVADFGVAKFDRKSGNSTTDGNLKGKLAYMAPEYLRGEPIDRRFDIFAMGVVLWEALTGQRLFRGQHEADTLQRLLEHKVPAVSSMVPAVGTSFDAIVDTALARSRDHRFDNAAAMANALESCARSAGAVATHREVAELVVRAVGGQLEERRALIRARLAHEPSVASAMVGPPDTMPSTTDPAPMKLPPTSAGPPPDPDAPSGPTPASTERSPVDPLDAKPVNATLKSEPTRGQTSERPAPAVVASSPVAEAPQPTRRARQVVIALGGLVALAGALALLRLGSWRAPADRATSAELAPSVSTVPAAATPSATAALSVEGLPQPTAPTSSVLPTPVASASAGSPRAHGSRSPQHRATPSATPVHEDDPPPNPYARP